jgi:phytoene dehydrogenase-like protein
MARVVVVGGGYAGMASAARLAKQGHEVTLLEAADRLGGALGTVEAEGYRWDSGPAHTLLPAVLRDLFRKSGRPLERELELVAQPVLREHRFEDESRLQLPGGSRAAQLRAFDGLGDGLGRQWCDHVASYADDWELLRREGLERTWSPDDVDPAARALLTTRETLHRRLRRTFRDERLRQVAAYPFLLDGHDLRNVPAWAGLNAYLEQRFGAWTVPGGMGRLAGVLADRLATRRVTVRTGTRVTDVVVRGGRAVAVATADGEVDADHVVCAVDPRQLPALAAYVRRTMPALPPVICHLGLRGPVPDLAPETVLHGDPTIVVRTGGEAPDGAHAWTLLGRGRLAEDIVLALARAGVDVRSSVEVRVDRSPRALVEEWSGSPLGVLWQGRNTVRDRLSTRTPVTGVYAAGAPVALGPGLPYVGLTAAQVAQAIGPA